MTGIALTRRSFLSSAAGYGASPPAGIADHGRVRPPIPLPAIPLILQDGGATTLSAVVQGHVTAIQIMFPYCTSTCPIGAATFSQVQDLLPDQVRRGIRLLSLDIAPTGDGATTLDAWLRRYSARPGWIAGSPNQAGLRAVQELFDQGRNFSENHSDRIHIVDRKGQLVWRTYELPAAEDIVSLLVRL